MDQATIKEQEQQATLRQVMKDVLSTPTPGAYMTRICGVAILVDRRWAAPCSSVR